MFVLKVSKKFFALMLCLAIVGTTVAGAFSDVDGSTEQGKAIYIMQEHGYIRGFEDGSFRPQATLTRAEFVTIINKMYGFTVEAENIFNDITPEDWYYNAVLVAVQAGYIKGMGDGRFAPNQPVTREQVCVILDSILKTERLPYSKNITDAVSDWARESVEKLLSNRLFVLEEGGKFRATQPITRGEVCVALEKCIVEVELDFVYEPINLESMAREELEKKLNNIIKCMEEKVIPSFTYDETVVVGEMLVKSMKEYLKDPEYDYVSDAKVTYKLYGRFENPMRQEFKNAIYDNINIDEIAVLFDFFYTPEIQSRK